MHCVQLFTYPTSTLTDSSNKPNWNKGYVCVCVYLFCFLGVFFKQNCNLNSHIFINMLHQAHWDSDCITYTMRDVLCCENDLQMQTVKQQPHCKSNEANCGVWRKCWEEPDVEDMLIHMNMQVFVNLKTKEQESFFLHV